MRIIKCEQYSPEWWAVRRGVPTASEFSRILTPKTMKLSEGSDKYIFELIADKFRSDYGVSEDYTTPAMRRGLLFEGKSRRCYEFLRGVSVERVGFCLDDEGRFGCSPDGLILEDGVLEMKNPDPSTHAEWFTAQEIPAKHKPQVHGQLIVTGRPWVDFMSYYPGQPPLIVRVAPDDYTQKLKDAMEIFWEKYQAQLAKFESLR